MRNSVKTILVVLLLTFVAGYYFRADLDSWFRSFEEKLEIQMAELEEVKQAILTPPPLRGPTRETASVLSVAGIVAETNIHRERNGLSPLSINAELTAAARAKVDDMFLQQYFAHESPSGKGPAELAKEAGYQYLLVGENLALGNYKDDSALVQAWMDSPGHRENILKPEYKEIGVAVKRGTYEGETTWLAVQEFGRPASDCPGLNETLKTKIKENQARITVMEQELKVRMAELETLRQNGGPGYNQKVNEYNQLVSEYNALVNETKTLIAEYNKEVQAYNTCAT